MKEATAMTYTSQVIPPTVTTPAPQPITRFVDHDGTPTQAGQSHGIDTELAQELFRHMTISRTLDREALSLQRQGQLGLWLMSWGQEAAQVGSISALRESDMVFPSYREHAAALYRGITPAQLFAQWKGVSHSGWDAREHHFHIYSLVLGTQALHAAGYAAGVKMDRSDEIVTAYFGDGASSQGDVNEALNWAAAGTLPVLFFVQNNQWAISTPPAAQMRTTLAQRAAGFGLAAWHVDGNDALAVHAVTRAAADWVREGNGPALIEAETYRMAGHSSSDDPTRYRAPSELAHWETRDPLLRLEALLKATGTAPSFFTGVADDAKAFASEAREACLGLAGTDLADLFNYAYAEPHSTTSREREQFITFRNDLKSEN